jgi:2-oxoglutarate ferredoxin oxidoreductase subunit delta
MSASATRGTVVIAEQRCKGCELCVPACPPRVLRMSERRNAIGARLPELLAGCTGCGACLLVCPDFCFEVYKYDEPVVHGEGRQARSARSDGAAGAEEKS